jgi:1-phosphofructokinase family hexose kinase
VIVTVTANAAIDRTIRVDRLVPGRLHRSREDHAQAGGKGLNVSRVLQTLGVPVHAIVAVGGASGDFICGDLTRAGIPHTAVNAEGASRTCLELVEDASGVVTQIHGEGIRGCTELAASLAEAVTARAAGATWVALCGSFPRGFPPAGVDALALAARAAGARLAADTSGEALARLIELVPDLVRVNRFELVHAVALGGGRAQGQSLGVGWPGPALPELALVSDGAAPVRTWSRTRGRAIVTPPAVAVSNPIGCGDSMLAGILAELQGGGDVDSAIAFGIGLGAAQAEGRVPGRPDVARARELASGVSVRWRAES